MKNCKKLNKKAPFGDLNRKLWFTANFIQALPSASFGDIIQCKTNPQMNFVIASANVAGYSTVVAILSVTLGSKHKKRAPWQNVMKIA